MSMEAGRLFTVFSDFNCPFCYALHERLHELRLIERCAWRGVQHAAHLPCPLKPWQGTLAVELRHEVSVVRRLAPTLPIQLPLGKPNTGLAIAYAAVLLARDPGAGMALVRAIYRAFWLEGRDISDKALMAELAGNAPIEVAYDHGQAIAEQWQAAWEATAKAGVPLIVAPNQDLLIGCVSVEELARFFAVH
jgi:predicted DsbA family dithiol-disulfide isomerase